MVMQGINPLSFSSQLERPPYSSPSTLTRRGLTLEEKSMFLANPISAIGKHFILDHDPDIDDCLPFKVNGVRASEWEVIYKVLFDGCCATEDLEGHEVESMMDNSDILE